MVAEWNPGLPENTLIDVIPEETGGSSNEGFTLREKGLVPLV